MAVILHVDMDAFFASVELLHHPEWRGKPVIVGSAPHERGVVSTCSYEARKFGVHSAMPSRTAYARCPNAIFTPPNMALYREVSKKCFDVFERFTPYVEGVSIDEAFLDITGSLHLYDNDPVCLGEALRATIRRACGITCSVGIAPNRLLAKLGSEEHKPDGLTLMPFDPDSIQRFLAPKRIGVLWGIGKTTEAELNRYGLKTCGDIQRLSREVGGNLPTFLSPELIDFAFGRADDRVYWQKTSEKSVSREDTFLTDEYSREAVRTRLLELVKEVGQRFRRERRWANTARLKVRDGFFATFTRQAPFDAPARDDITFREKALALFDAAFPYGETLPKPIRLIGFGVTNIQELPGNNEPLLFADPENQRREKRERLSATLDALRAKGLGV